MNKRDLKVVVGLGKTGFSCVRYLLANGCNVAVIDSREHPPCLNEMRRMFPKVPIVLGTFAADFLEDASELIVSPGVSLRELTLAGAIGRGIPAIGDIELFARAAQAPVVAITGSNGKSTVTTLVGEMAKKAGRDVRVGGNLGEPALDLLNGHDPDLYVLELSSFQLETTFSLQPAAATVLNVTPDHLDRYATFAEYLHAKQRIYHGAQCAVVNRDDPQSYAGLVFPKVISFGLDAPEAGEFGLRAGFLAYGNENLISSADLKIKGRHQIANALAALALGMAVDLPIVAMLETLRNFTGLAHRCQWVRQIAGVDFYNDSKGTNVGATQAAIAGIGAEISGRVVLIAGGLGKDADFSELRPVVQKYLRKLILIGQDAPKIAAALAGACDIVNASSMQEAVEMARDAATTGDAVLLSPACASYDMFDNFEHRGQIFAAAVRELK